MMTNSQRKTHDTLAVVVMRSLINKAESPNQPIVSMPSISFALYMLVIETSLTISLVLAFIFRLFCL